MDKPYTHRELEMKFDFIARKIDENHKETIESIELTERKNHDKHLENSAKLEKIEQQTTMTNGRVRKLEKWQSAIIMAGTVTIFLGSVIVSLIVYIYNYQLDIQTKRIDTLNVAGQFIKTN